MLRFFVKTDKRLAAINEVSGTKTLSNYHIKTLMLWAAELQPRHLWITDVNAVRICTKLLHTLSVWLTNARCQHYFINSCNLVDSTFNLEIIASHLMSITKSWLSTWFVNNYILNWCEHCHFFGRPNVCRSIKLRNAVSEIVKWRLDIEY